MPTPDQFSPRRRSGLTNSIANVLGLLIPLAVFFMVTPSIVRGLGAEHFGVLTLFLTALILLTSFDFGLSAGGVRCLGAALHAGGRPKMRLVAGELWSAYFILALVLATLLIVFRESVFLLLGIEVSLAKGVGSFALPVAVFFGFCSMALAAIPKAMENFVGLTAIQVFFGTASWIGIAFGVHLGWGLDWALLWWAAMGAATFLALALWTMHLAGGLAWLPRWHFEEIGHSLSYNMHAFWGQLASGATYHADKFLISHFLGSAAVGYYGLASSVSTKLLSLVAALAGFVFPRSVRMFAADDLVGLRETYVRATRYILLVTWPMLIVALLVADKFIRLWVGASFADEMTSVLELLLLSYFVTSLSVVASQVFNGIGNSRVGAIFSSLGAAINLLACVIFIPLWGLKGAALASLISMIQVFGYTHSLHRRLELRRFPFAGLWVRLLAVGLIQVLVLWLCHGWINGWWSLLFVAFLGWVSFYFGWFALRFADEGDSVVVKQLLKMVRQKIQDFKIISKRGA